MALLPSTYAASANKHSQQQHAACTIMHGSSIAMTGSYGSVRTRQHGQMVPSSNVGWSSKETWPEPAQTLQVTRPSFVGCAALGWAARAAGTGGATTTAARVAATVVVGCAAALELGSLPAASPPLLLLVSPRLLRATQRVTPTL